jgi:HEAT repeat protein
MPLIRKPQAQPPAPQDAGNILSALQTGNEEQRWAAARAAPEIAGGAKALGEALGMESNPRVREAIFTSLARIGSTEAIELMLPFIRSDDAQLRTGALDALRAGKEAAWPYVPQLLGDADADVRLLACELARTLPAEQGGPLLCALLDRDAEVNVCASAIEVLAEVGSQEALPFLARCAERFRGNAFLEFSIKVTVDRIASQALPARD